MAYLADQLTLAPIEHAGLPFWPHASKASRK
jgi:hypothetical protein